MATVTFRNFQAQPPTPPKAFKAVTEHAQRFLEDNYNLDFDHQKSKSAFQNHVNLATPPQSSPQQANSGSSKQSKEVRFIQQPLPDDCPSSLRPVLPSKALKSSKSILKPHDPSPSHQPISDPFSNHEIKSTFKKMLESALQMLEGNDLVSRHDAYRVLNSSIRAQNAIPDSKTLRENLPLLEEFIRRDIAEGRSPQSVKDLTLPALKLATTLMHLKCGQTGGFKLGFYSFLADQALAVIRQPNPRKDLATHFLHLFTLRPMYRKALTPDRITDFLASLEDVQDRVSGKNVVSLRLIIYRSFLTHYPSSLSEKPGMWLHHVFHGMLAENSDLRDRAIQVAIAVGESLGSQRSIAQTAFDLLNQEGAKYQNHFETVLVKNMEDNDTARSVPQIWGALMLLLRGDRDKLETWFCSSSWLKIVEECFNSSDPELNLDAFLAWNRTIFALGSSISCKPRVMVRLRSPIIGNLQRLKLPAKVRMGALSTLCALIYHSFRPGIAPENMTLCWKLYVLETFTRILDKSSVSVSHLAKVLSALLFNSNVRVWSADRALKTGSDPLKPEEVPRLDAQWIRTNIELVSKVVFPILQKLFHSPKSNDDTLGELWAGLLRAITDAGSKEIKLSMESKKAYAEITNLLHRLWQMAFLNSSKDITSDTQSVRMFLSLVRSAVQILGPIHLGESILIRTDGGVFEATTTPSRHTPPRSNLLQSPILVIVKPLLQIQVHGDDAIKTDIREILSPCWEAKGSRALKIAFGKHCCNILLPQETEKDVETVGSQVWSCIANSTTTVLQKDLPLMSNDGPAKIGQELSDVVDIMRAGLQFSDSTSLDTASRLFESLCQSTKAVAGDAGVVLIVTEPLVKHLERSIDSFSNNMNLCYISSILGEGINIPSQRTLDHAKKALWDRPPSTQDVSGLAWLSSLYSSISRCLKNAYDNLCDNTSPVVNTFLSALATFLNDQTGKARSTIPGVELFFWNLSAGICLWIEDRDGKVLIRNEHTAEFRAAVERLWISILSVISRFPLKSKVQLKLVEAVLCSGFQSRSKLIADLTVTAWNNSFGAEEKLEYPATLLRLLHSLRSIVDISLPSFPADISSELEFDCSNLVGEQSDKEHFLWLGAADESSLQSKTSPENYTPMQLSKRPNGSLHLRPTPEPTSTCSELARAVPKRTPPPRLRHHDSQIQYVAVTSSPMDSTGQESQILTENQKEVKLRQRGDLSLFKDIGSSSPISTLTSFDLPHKRSNAQVPRQNFMPDISGMSPVHEIDDMSDVADMIDSSPLAPSQRSSSLPFARTPVRGMPSLRIDLPDEVEDVPSSPPEVPVGDGIPIMNHNEVDETAAKVTSQPSKTEIVVEGHAAKEDEMSSASNTSALKGKLLESSHGSSITSVLPAVATTVEKEEILPVGNEDTVNSGEEEPVPVSDNLSQSVGTCTSDIQHPESQISPSRCDEVTSVWMMRAVDAKIDTNRDLEMPDMRKLAQSDAVSVDDTTALVPNAQDALALNLSLDHASSVATDFCSTPDLDSPEVHNNVDKDTSLSDLNVDPSISQPLANTKRMIATHVLIPSPVSKQDYEDFSQVDNNTNNSQMEHEAVSQTKKRKSPSPISEIVSKKPKTMAHASGIRTIIVRAKGPNSPSLRSLVTNSALLVDKNALAGTPARASQRVSASQSQVRKNRKRRSSTVEKPEDLDESLESQELSQVSHPASKKQKCSTSSHISLAAPASQASQRRSSRLSGESFDGKSGHKPQSQSRGIGSIRSGLSSAYTPVELDDMPQQLETASALIDVEFVAVSETLQHQGVQSMNSEGRVGAVASRGSPWDDTTVDITTLVVPGAPAVTPDSTAASIATTPSRELKDMTAQPISPSLARSIMGRLRGILVDCKKLVLGPGHVSDDDEREFEEMQDLAHELQGEILKARRRSRAT